MPISPLTIYSYASDPGDSPSKPSAADTFVAPINPERFTRSRTVRFNEDNPSSDKGTNMQAQGYGEDQVSFDLILDGTGAIPEIDKEVAEYIEQLEKIAYEYDGEAHQPRYLIMVWGDFGFKCKLATLNIEYNLFKADGSPLRAKASLTLQGKLSTVTQQLQADPRSPDLTRVHTVREGDSLPVLCEKYYKNHRYYVQVAEANGLAGFRDLVPGMQIVFPPIAR
ncbi:MAG: hypothetical protein OHK0039_16230 [Bacteroidia bacterium]